MKRVFLLIAVVIVSLGLAAAIWAYRSASAKAKREAGYQAALQEYSNDLKPGLARQEVESYLRSRGVRFTQMCCVGQPRDAWADLVKVGEESVSWPCSECYVNIAFEFRATEPHRLRESRNSDVLESVRIFRQFRCL
jgi:hypothetical protein